MLDLKCPFEGIDPEIFKLQIEELKHITAANAMKYDHIANVLGRTISNMVYEYHFKPKLDDIAYAIESISKRIKILEENINSGGITQ